MPSFVNRNSHPARVPHPKGGPLRRIVPGQVVEATGDYADALESTPGFESASGDDKKRWEQKLESQRVASALPGDGSRISAKLAIGPARNSVRMQTIVAPLQRVVGDDAAPYAPDSGTITTKAQQAQVSAQHAEAMAQGEVAAVLGERVEGVEAATNADIVISGDVTQEQIHNAQVENREAAEEAAQAFIGATSGEPLADDSPIDGDYDNPRYTKAQLEAEAHRRGLEVGGKGHKSDVVAALKADDDK